MHTLKGLLCIKILWYRGSSLPQKHFKPKQVFIDCWVSASHAANNLHCLHLWVRVWEIIHIKPDPKDYTHPSSQVHLILVHTLNHTQLSLSYSSFFFFLFSCFGGEGGRRVALLRACSCILGFLAGFQGANKTPLYPRGVGTAFRLSCRCWDETQRSYTGGRGGNEQPPVINHVLSAGLFWTGEHSNHQKPTWKVEI